MRHTVNVTISTEGRDKGKTFVLTEMPAIKAEKWAMRALLALARSGVDLGNVSGMGMQGLAIMGLHALAGLAWEDAEPLFDEMMSCVQIKEPATTRELFDEDIEELSTRLLLRQKILELHVGFSLAGNGSK